MGPSVQLLSWNQHGVNRIILYASLYMANEELSRKFLRRITRVNPNLLIIAIAKNCSRRTEESFAGSLRIPNARPTVNGKPDKYSLTSASPLVFRRARISVCLPV